MADNIPDYSDFKTPAAAGDNILARLHGLAHELVDAEAEVARIEEDLKAAQAKVLDLQQFKIPELMDAAETEKHTTKDGLCIDVSTVIRASIKEENKPAAFAWLAENNHDNLIKRQFVIEFGKDEESWAKKFQADLAKRKKPLNVALKRGVNPQTLAAFVREELEKGTTLPLATLGVMQQRFAKVKLPKAKDKRKKQSPDGPAPF